MKPCHRTRRLIRLEAPIACSRCCPSVYVQVPLGPICREEPAVARQLAPIAGFWTRNAHRRVLDTLLFWLCCPTCRCARHMRHVGPQTRSGRHTVCHMHSGGCPELPAPASPNPNECVDLSHSSQVSWRILWISNGPHDYSKGRPSATVRCTRRLDHLVLMSMKRRRPARVDQSSLANYRLDLDVLRREIMCAGLFRPY
ncbi:hypothetical protein BD413DRAFT_72251 [Trametes elegans]|nr:hypothetical protein BD413DRAFT_72251 [Trametes elegans]